MRLGTWVGTNARIWPYRTQVPARIVLHMVQCPPGTNLEPVARTHENPPHLWVSMPNGQIVQSVDTDLAARALLHPAGAVETNHAHAIQIEIAGYAENVDTYPDDWWEWLGAEVVRPLAAAHHVNLADHPSFHGSTLAYGEGSSTRMSSARWLGFNGICGHQHVPANHHWDPGPVPIDLIVSAAQGTAPSSEDDMTPEQEAKLDAVLKHLSGRSTDPGDQPRPIRDAIGDTLDIVKAMQSHDAKKIAALVISQVGEGLAEEVADEIGRRIAS